MDAGAGGAVVVAAGSVVVVVDVVVVVVGATVVAVVVDVVVLGTVVVVAGSVVVVVVEVVVVTGTVVTVVLELVVEGIVEVVDVDVDEDDVVDQKVVVVTLGIVVVVMALFTAVMVVAGADVVVTISATCNVSGDATYVFGQVLVDFHTSCRVVDLAHVGIEPVAVRNEARVLPLGQVPVFAYFKVLELVTQTTALDRVVQVILVSPLPQAPVLVVPKITCDRFTQNLAVVVAPLAD